MSESLTNYKWLKIRTMRHRAHFPGWDNDRSALFMKVINPIFFQDQKFIMFFLRVQRLTISEDAKVILYLIDSKAAKNEALLISSEFSTWWKYIIMISGTGSLYFSSSKEFLLSETWSELTIVNKYKQIF